MIDIDNRIFYQKNKRFYCTLSDRIPVSPYRLEKNINNNFAYIIDGNGIVWIKHHIVFLPDEDYGICYSDACLRECMTYIIATEGYNAYLNIKKYITEHLVPFKEDCYDSCLKKYNKMWLDNN